MIGGKDYANAQPRDITESGTSHVPEDRQEDGLVLAYSVADNLVLNSYYLPPFASGLDDRRGRDAGATRFGWWRSTTSAPPRWTVPVSTLSGGNKQKVVIARELSRPVKLLIAAQPTRGLDVGSIEFIHQTIVAQRDRGTAVLLVSSELDEIMSLVGHHRGDVPGEGRRHPPRRRGHPRGPGPPDGRRSVGLPPRTGLSHLIHGDAA